MCTFLLQNGALWDKGQVHCWICETGLLAGNSTACNAPHKWPVTTGNTDSASMSGSHHYYDVIQGAMASQSPARRLFTQPLFRRRSKKTSKLRATGLCAGNSPVTGEFPAQMASNAENVSIWCRHHDHDNPWFQSFYMTYAPHVWLWWCINSSVRHWTTLYWADNYLNPCWLVVNWALGNKFQCKLNQSTIVFHAGKGIWKCCLQNGNPIASVWMCQTRALLFSHRGSGVHMNSIDCFPCIGITACTWSPRLLTLPGKRVWLACADINDWKHTSLLMLGTWAIINNPLTIYQDLCRNAGVKGMISNKIPYHLWDMIIYPCSTCLKLCVRSKYDGHW